MPLLKTRIFIVATLYFLSWKGGCNAEKRQFFLVKPQDAEVVEGGTVVLPCQVGNQAGQVQWSKDGFVLGFERDIPGYPRYSMLGNEAEGVHNLQVANAQIDDDGEYQCQVGPTATNKAIRADARLTVLVPPTSIRLEGHQNGSVVEVREKQNLSVKCVVEGSKPAAQIKWFRKQVQLRPDHVEYHAEEGGEEKRFTAVSTIRLSPSPEDNGVKYWCEAVHPALHPGAFRVSLDLSVLYPPGPPEIEGYQEGETLRKGDTLTLVCISRGGNPLATVIWYRGDEAIDVSYTTDGRHATTNSLTLLLEPSDNNAVYRCEASNTVTPRPMSIQIKLTVHFAPSKVTVTGPREARVGDTVLLECKTDPSNPPSEVSWVRDGRPLSSTGTTTTPSPNGGYITTSIVNITIRDNQERGMKMFSCYAVNQAIGETKVETFVLSVLYPPGEPAILGYTSGTPIKAGAIQRMSCVTRGGNPLPLVRWFRGDREIPGTTMTTTDNTVATDLEFVARESDNGAEFRCEATNSAAVSPKIVSVKLTVFFPPPGVTIKLQPKEPKAGQRVVLTCETAGSNPPALVTWWREGFLLPTPEDTNLKMSTYDTPFGGKATRSVLTFNATSRDNGRNFACRAANPELEPAQAVHESLILHVLYKPEFQVSQGHVFSSVEGSPTSINLTAHGNPTAISYVWYREGQLLTEGLLTLDRDQRIAAMGPVLSIDMVRRTDAGDYECEATNEEGKSSIKVSLNVQYEAVIVQVTQNATAAEGDDAVLECLVNANPLKEDTVTWRRDNFDMLRRTQTVMAKEGHSYLTIFNVSRHDTGFFGCTAFNGIGKEQSRQSLLLVKHKPEIDRSPQLSKAAGELGKMASLRCRAQGAPDVSFTWKRNGIVIPADSPTKYVTTLAWPDPTSPSMWNARLEVHHLAAEDYGPYECIASNELGSENFVVSLDRPSVPDPPTSLRVLNVTHDSVTFETVPGFDGGVDDGQRFRVGYRPLLESNEGGAYVLADVGNATVFTIGPGLTRATRYAFQILAYNTMGASDWTKETVYATTLDEAPVVASEKAITEALSSKGDLPKIIIITVSIVGSALLVLNIILVVCFVRKRRKKRLEEEESDHGSSTTKTATIEMYAPSSYTDPPVNCETLSCNSEKSGGVYSDGGQSANYSDDPSSRNASTYIIDKGGERPYIPDGGYRYLDPVQTYKSIDRTSNLSNSIIYETDEDRYAEALRRNAYNHKLGEKGFYNKDDEQPPIIMTPTSGPMPDAIQNCMVSPPTARYVSYPMSSVPPPAMLSTFGSAEPSATSASNHRHRPSSIVDGHLV